MKNKIKTFVFMLIIVLGIGYILEFILWPFCILFGWNKFSWDDLIKLGAYLFITGGLFIQDYLRKRKRD